MSKIHFGKKCVAIALALSLTLTAAACGKKKDDKVDDPQETQAVNNEVDSKETTEPETVESDDGNMVDNGDFSRGTEKWMLYLDKGGSAELTADDGVGTVSIIKSGNANYAVQLYYDGFKLETGGIYRFQFDAWSTIDRSIEARLQINGGDYHAYAMDTVNLAKDKQTFIIEFEMVEATDPSPRLCFNMGTPDGQEAFAEHQVFIDNVEVVLLDGSNIAKPEPEPVLPDININQIGYRPNDTKIAILRGDNLADTFEVVDESGNVVFSGKLGAEIVNETADEINRYADFSGLTTEGTYTIRCGQAVESYPFVISDNVYEDAYDAVVRMIYLQRCGVEVKDSSEPSFSHDACHLGEAIIYGTNETKDVSGGWHDAGDYGRYVVTGVKTAADLLLAYSAYPEQFGDDLGIPESGNGIPDVLDEVRFELEWLLKMQDTKTGGVYHKVTGLAFPGVVMPTEETEQLYLAPISNTATGDFAAIMAMSYNYFKDYDKAFADKCLEAAKKAWAYLEETPNGNGFKNPDDILTGEYPDGTDRDERFWAACELYKLTGDAVYKETIDSILKMYVLNGYGWSNMGSYGSLAYLSLDEKLQNPEYVQKIKDNIIARADKYVEASKSDYGISIGSVYPWGSNMSVANNAMELLVAYSINPKQVYLDTAVAHFHYLFGNNPMSMCYVTGFGTRSPQNTHHRPSMVLEASMPGMLVGGPNSNLEDPYAKAVLADKPPAKCYADNSQSYSCNEVTVYWNSPLIYVMAGVLDNTK